MVILPAVPTDPDNPRLGWHNLVTFGNISASSAVEGFPATNLANGETFLTWKAANNGAQTIVIDLGAARTVSYFGMARHNLGTAGIGYTLQSSADGAAWGSIADTVVPTSDGIILHEVTPVTIRYLRISLGAGSVPAQMAVLYVGVLTVLQRRIYVGHVPIQMGRQSLVSTGFSESGQFLGRVLRRVFVQGKVSVSNLTPDWYRTYMEPFAAVAAVQPFFWAWRPGTYPSEVGYVWTTDDLQPQNARSNGMMQVEFGFQGIVR